MISWSDEALEKTAGPSDVILNALLGKPDDAGRRIRPRPDQFPRTPHASKVVQELGGRPKIAPRSLPGGATGAVIKHPLIATLLLGGYLLNRRGKNREKAMKEKLLRGARAISYEAPTGVF